MTTRTTKTSSPRGRKRDRARFAGSTPEDAKRTQERAHAAERLARATMRLREAEASGDARAIATAEKQRDRAARALAGPDGDPATLRHSARMLAVEKAAHAKLTAAGRARAREVAAHSLAIVAAEHVTSPLDLLAVSVGARVLGLALAVLEERGASDLRTAVYGADRGLALIERAVERTRQARAAEDAEPGDGLALAAERLRAYRAARERATDAAEPGNQNVLSDGAGDEPEPTTTGEDAPEPRHGLAVVPLAEAPARAGSGAASGNVLAPLRDETDGALDRAAFEDGRRAVDELPPEHRTVAAARVLASGALGVLAGVRAHSLNVPVEEG